MSIAEKLKMINKKTRTLVISGALAMAAVSSPIKAQSAEVGSTFKDNIILTASKDAVKKQAFESAVKANLPREEIAKYVDFPQFMPVDKNGQLDEIKVQKLLQDSVTNHIDSLKKFYRTISDTHKYCGGMYGGRRIVNTNGFYKALENFIGEISDSKEGTSEIMQKIAKYQNNNWTKTADKAAGKYVVEYPIGNFDQTDGGIGFLSAFIGGVIILAGTGITIFGLKEKKEGQTTLGLALLTVGALGLIYGIKNLKDVKQILHDRFSDPKDAIVFMQDSVKQVYDNYLDGTIQTEKDRQTAVAKAEFDRRFKAAQRQ